LALTNGDQGPACTLGSCHHSEHRAARFYSGAFGSMPSHPIRFGRQGEVNKPKLIHEHGRDSSGVAWPVIPCLFLLRTA